MVTIAPTPDNSSQPAFGHQVWLSQRLAEKALHQHTDGSTVTQVVSGPGQEAISLAITDHPEYGKFVHVTGSDSMLGEHRDTHLLAHKPGPNHEGKTNITRSHTLPAKYAQAVINHLRTQD